MPVGAFARRLHETAFSVGPSTSVAADRRDIAIAATRAARDLRARARVRADRHGIRAPSSALGRSATPGRVRAERLADPAGVPRGRARALVSGSLAAASIRADAIDAANPRRVVRALESRPSTGVEPALPVAARHDGPIGGRPRGRARDATPGGRRSGPRRVDAGLLDEARAPASGSIRRSRRSARSAAGRRWAGRRGRAGARPGSPMTPAAIRRSRNASGHGSAASPTSSGSTRDQPIAEQRSPDGRELAGLSFRRPMAPPERSISPRPSRRRSSSRSTPATTPAGPPRSR